ncbi:hypothetical protein ACFQX8_02670 [Klenkia terrae]|uniref:hypothetical protein n=1 Tax=Klenkia terrae TaxID=1052259 RepID=UPI003610825F
MIEDGSGVGRRLQFPRFDRRPQYGGRVAAFECEQRQVSAQRRPRRRGGQPGVQALGGVLQFFCSHGTQAVVGGDV